MDYLGIRDLLVLLRQIIQRERELGNQNDYSLSLSENIYNEIKEHFEDLRRGEISISLEKLLRELSNQVYIKGQQEFRMFQFQDPRPFCPYCKKSLPDVINRRCSYCKELTIQQKIGSKEIYENLTTDYKQELKCSKCNKQILVRHLNCPNCNPDDLPSKDLPEENRDKAYIFPDQLLWGPCTIVFTQNFFNTILKGIEFEQQIYHEIKSYIPENQIKISTRIKIGANNGWGVEVDLLLADKREGIIKNNFDWTLYAIEVKNQEEKVDINEIQKFYENVSPITKNLIFVSKSGFTDRAIRLLKFYKMNYYCKSIKNLFKNS